VVENNRVSQFRAITKITFVLDEGASVEADLSEQMRSITP
jgi:hypothetical protein